MKKIFLLFVFVLIFAAVMTFDVFADGSGIKDDSEIVVPIDSPTMMVILILTRVGPQPLL